MCEVNHALFPSPNSHPSPTITINKTNQDKRLILKSPSHTARVRILRELFPGAKFIHIRYCSERGEACSYSCMLGMGIVVEGRRERNDGWVYVYADGGVCAAVRLRAILTFGLRFNQPLLSSLITITITSRNPYEIYQSTHKLHEKLLIQWCLQRPPYEVRVHIYIWVSTNEKGFGWRCVGSDGREREWLSAPFIFFPPLSSHHTHNPNE